MVGYRFAGWKGAVAAMSGFLGAPILIIIGIGVAYQHFGAVPFVKQALVGMSSVAVGLLLATAAKLAKVLQWRWRPWVFVVLAFAAVGIMRCAAARHRPLAPFAIAERGGDPCEPTDPHRPQSRPPGFFRVRALTLPLGAAFWSPHAVEQKRWLTEQSSVRCRGKDHARRQRHECWLGSDIDNAG